MVEPSTEDSARSSRIEQLIDIDHGHRRAEWFNGRLVPLPPVHAEIDLLTTFFVRLLGELAETTVPGRVLKEPFLMQVEPGLPARTPDVFFVLQANLDRVKPLGLEGPADFVLEVLHPNSRAATRTERFREYERNGVPEYWVVDPKKRQVKAWAIGEDWRYHLIAPMGTRLHSTVLPTFWVDCDWLWKRPLPRVRDVIEVWEL